MTLYPGSISVKAMIQHPVATCNLKISKIHPNYVKKQPNLKKGVRRNVIDLR